ncbi:MAG: hypothetical protein HYV45_01130 [Candidatus Moranbacteria bacterium]|nr:hypothetical protein [Candidatus Moranbacteria bacterium]
MTFIPSLYAEEMSAVHDQTEDVIVFSVRTNKPLTERERSNLIERIQNFLRRGENKLNMKVRYHASAGSRDVHVLINNDKMSCGSKMNEKFEQVRSLVCGYVLGFRGGIILEHQLQVDNISLRKGKCPPVKFDRPMSEKSLPRSI